MGGGWGGEGGGGRDMSYLECIIIPELDFFLFKSSVQGQGSACLSSKAYTSSVYSGPCRLRVWDAGRDLM